MNRTMKWLMVSMLAAQAQLAFANPHAERDWPSVVPTPALDVPLRDTAITRGPDGMYYLTGTLQGKGPSGASDFENGRKIKIWQSKDLKKLRCSRPWSIRGCRNRARQELVAVCGRWSGASAFTNDGKRSDWGRMAPSLGESIPDS